MEKTKKEVCDGQADNLVLRDKVTALEDEFEKVIGDARAKEDEALESKFESVRALVDAYKR